MSRFLNPLLSLALFAAAAAASAQRKPAPAPSAALTPREQAAQLLNRFTFGPRTGEVERVLAEGPDAWLTRQLKPSAIPDPVLEKRLEDYPTLALSPAQALKSFADRNIVTQVADGKLPSPTDPLLRGVYEVEIYKLQQERNNPPHPEADQTPAQRDTQKLVDQATATRVAGQLLALPSQQRMTALNAMPAPDRVAFATALRGPERKLFLAEATPREREALEAMQGKVGSQNRLNDELAQARQLRAILSERQLQEVMTEFWFNHFNIFAPKEADKHYTAAYERDTIRPHALGKFRDLLLATAESPAMMIYLDNWLSIGPNSEANSTRPRNPNRKKVAKGLNENYGREVMELHTLGVNGGYTQADVTHLSAILTGWSVERPNLAGTFVFAPRKHEPGTKEWFGYRIDEQGKVSSAKTGAPTVLPAAQQQAIQHANVPDGMRQGVAALVLLAGAPQTAHFMSFLLAQRFVADQPPPALVDRLTATYLASDGDIATLLRTLVDSPEFNSRRYFRNKVKTPQEFVASAFRATGTDPQNPGALVGFLSKELGEPPYRKLEPTGYYVTADHWMNTQALMSRLNFADQLTHGRFANQAFDSSRLLPGLMAQSTSTEAPAQSAKPVHASPVADPAAAPPCEQSSALGVLEDTLVEGQVSASTDKFIRGQLAAQACQNPGDQLNQLTALLLGSPEFQVR